MSPRLTGKDEIALPVENSGAESDAFPNTSMASMAGADSMPLVGYCPS